MNATTDWFTVDEIADGSYRITEGAGVLPCHTYVAADGDEALLIDTGLGIGDLRTLVEDLVGTPRVLLTHSHWDHIGGAHAFDDVVIDDRERTAGGRVAIDGLSDESVERPKQFVDDWLAAGNAVPDGFDPDVYAIEPTEDVGVVEPGQTLTVGERDLELLATPGHSPGQLAVLDRTAGICHGADVLEPGGTIYAHLEHSDVAAYRDTFERLVDRRDAGAFDALTLGHGDPIEGDDLAILDDALVAFEEILDGSGAFECIETHWGPTRRYTVAGLEVLTRD